MSGRVDKLSRAATDLEQVLQRIACGAPGSQRRIPRIDLAAEHLDAWADTNPPASNVGAERGGSSSPREIEDRTEGRALARQVRRDTDRLPELVKRIEHDCREVYLLMIRYVETVNPERLPKSTPRCVSCARPQDVRIAGSGFYADIAAADKHGVKRWGVDLAASVAKLHLCSFCRTHAVANAAAEKAKDVGVRHFPPLRAIDLLHRQSEQAAGRWLAKTAAA